MAFTRKSLAGLGLSEDMIEKVMTLHGTSMADFIPKSELKAKIEEAVADAHKNAPAPNIKDSDDYKALEAEFSNYKKKIETSAELKKGGVKEKFIDNVYSLLTDEKPASEQLESIREKYEEYFNLNEQPAPAAPQFGAETKGQMPSGKVGNTFEHIWGIGTK
nr:MAG TPA: hypothetical protein [Caudoviricetes sp.]